MNSKIIGVIVLLLIVAGVGAYFFSRENVENDSAMEQGEVTENTMEKVSPTVTAENPPAAVGKSKEISITASNFKFSQTKLSIKKGESVKIIFKNTEGMHDFVIDELDVRTKVLKEGEEETLEFVAEETGNFEFYCSVGEHRQQGMVGTLTVK